MIEKLKSHYGFAKTPFGRRLAPQMLHRHGTHAEAVARIGWCISERGLGVVTGEVGAGKTVAVRAALATLDSSRHTVIYLGNPAVGGRGLYGCIVTALGGVPRFHKASLIPQTMDQLAGRSDTLFSDDAIALIHQVSRGLPRAVNNLAVQALVAAFAGKKAIVDESSARAAIAEVTAE